MYLCKKGKLKMNFIQKYKINNQLNRFVKRGRKDNLQVCSLEKAEKICIFHTFQSQEVLEQIIKSANLLKKKHLVIYCFLPHNTENSTSNQETVAFISKKDFNFTGNLKKEKLLLLQAQQFDLLIDLDKETTLFSLYLTRTIQAKFRIGRCEKSKQYFNLTLCSSDENMKIETYFQSIDQYTKKIIS